jgi:hypothetical protein
MCLSETDSTVRIGKQLSDRIPINNGLERDDDITPLLSHFALQLAIRTVQVNRYRLKLNGISGCGLWWDGNIQGVSYIYKEALVVASEEI